MTRYYLTQRPPMPGAFPKPKGNGIELVTEYVDGRHYIPEIGRLAWGYVEYEKPLTEKEAANYELVRRKDGMTGDDNEYIERKDDTYGNEAQNS